MTVNGLAFSSDASMLAAVGGGGQGGIWNAKTGLQARTLKRLPASAGIVRFSRDGKQLIVIGTDGIVEVLETATGEQAAQFSVKPVN